MRTCFLLECQHRMNSGESIDMAGVVSSSLYHSAAGYA
jgi:hypothetical protein